ncbi:MAG: hypothetical protein JST93_24810 [Acidobacteria bacterium]|nr:hypothetical protein [Acidobacteriota bacterium]
MPALLPLALSLFLNSASAQYTIRTVAGGGPPNNTPALQVAIGNLEAIAVSPAGEQYIVDTQRHRVFKVSATGQLSIVAGLGFSGFSGDGGPATSAALNLPLGLALDSGGNLYIADSANYRVRKVAPNGVITTVAGDGQPKYSGDGGHPSVASIYFPAALAVDSAGNLYIAEAGPRIRKVSPSGIITTIAGNGASGYSGDGGPAIAGSFSYIGGFAPHPSGDLYISDTGNNRIRRVTSAGQLDTVAGTGSASFSGDGGPAHAASLSIPGRILSTPAGDLIFCDAGNHRVRKIAADGKITTIAGTGGIGFAGDGGPALNATFYTPRAIDLDAAGNLYVGDSYNHRIRRITPGGAISTIAGNGNFSISLDGTLALDAQFKPSGITLDSAGNWFIADGESMRIFKIGTDGRLTTIAGGGFTVLDGPALNVTLDFPSSTAFDRSGNLYLTEDRNSIRRISPAGLIERAIGRGGSVSFSGDGGPAIDAGIASSGRIAVDNDGNLFFTDRGNHRVRKVTPAGIITTVAGNGVQGFSGDGGPAINAALNLPLALAVDGAGALYIGDQGNSRIRKVSPTGIISTIAGNGGSGFSGDGRLATEANIFNPRTFALDTAGNLLIADTENHRIRRIANGVISTIAGNGQPSSSGDGGPATNASIPFPSGLAVDSTGNIYITDSSGRIRLLTPTITAQPAALSFTMLAPSATVTATSASGAPIAAAVTAGPAWLTVNPVTTASPATFTVTANPSSLPQGTHLGTIRLTSAGVFTDIPVLLTNTCSYSVSPTGVTFPATASTATITLETNAPCQWSAATLALWVRVNNLTRPVTGSGPATLTLAADANTGFARATTAIIAGQSISINQSAAGNISPGLRFVPLAPCRVADTRLADGSFGGPRLTAGQTRSFPIPASNCGIPPTAAAYSLNATVVPQSVLSYLTLWPTGQSQPLVSTLNSFDGRIKANAAIVPAGNNGSISAYVTHATDLILDINGYFIDSAGASFYPVLPCRIADTRPNATLVANQTRTVNIGLASCPIPPTATAYSLNFTAVPQGPLGYLTTWPTGQPQPFVSTLNAPTGAVTANAAIVPAGANNSIDLFATNTTDVVIDINGYFAPPGGPNERVFQSVAPCRIADTRPNSILAAGETRAFNIPASPCAIPAGATAYSLNVTVVPTGPLSYLTLWPSNSARPLVSTLNAFDGAVTSNAAIVPASLTGTLSVYVTNETHVILDINGYFR